MCHLDNSDLLSLFFYLIFTNLLVKFHYEDKLIQDPKSVDLVPDYKQNYYCLSFKNFDCCNHRILTCF